MAEGSGTEGMGPYQLTTEMLQALLAVRDRPPQNSYLKLRDPEPFEGDKEKFKTFFAQCELKFRTERNRFDDEEKNMQPGSDKPATNDQP